MSRSRSGSESSTTSGDTVDINMIGGVQVVSELEESLRLLANIPKEKKFLTEINGCKYHTSFFEGYDDAFLIKISSYDKPLRPLLICCSERSFASLKVAKPEYNVMTLEDFGLSEDSTIAQFRKQMIGEHDNVRKMIQTANLVPPLTASALESHNMQYRNSSLVKV
jgi:hypothetical protein